MLNCLKETANLTRTENGALTYASTQSHCLDWFATLGALRNESEAEIRCRFFRAFAENPSLAMKALFYGRDIRGGLGERRLFRAILPALAAREDGALKRNLKHIPEYGRWDDLLALMDTPAEKQAVRLMRSQLYADLAALEKGEGISLLAKWLPSENASNEDASRLAVRLAHAFGMSVRDYRRALSKLRENLQLAENNLRTGDMSMNYSALPSRAMFKYRRAFMRRDNERYMQFLSDAADGKAKLNASALMPYDVIRPAMSGESLTESERMAMDTTWKALPDYTGGDNALVVADGSGSMYFRGNPTPAMVAQSLAIYFAERNTGAFKDHFITFSSRPQLIHIQGRDITEKVRYCMDFNECANTNIMAVFELLLSAAMQNNVPQSELPSTLYFITDMEFDACAQNADKTCFQAAEWLFREAGYRLPTVVFWNVDSRNAQQPVRKNDRGVVLVSGASPAVFAQVLTGEESPTPWEQMMAILESDRYAPITA